MILSQEDIDKERRAGRPFRPFRMVGCFVHHGDELLLLHRHPSGPQPNLWSIPSRAAPLGSGISREVSGELKKILRMHTPIMYYLDHVNIRHGTRDFVYHLFAVQVEEKPRVHLNPAEYGRFEWRTPGDVHLLNLLEDMQTCIQKFFVPYLREAV